MPLEREQFRACIDILINHVNVPQPERQAFLTRALYGEAVLEQVTWTGNARTFATNLVRTLNKFDGIKSLVTLLEALREEVGEPTSSNITRLIEDLAAPTRLDTSSPEVGDSPPKVFISYSRQDIAIVNQLRKDLEHHNIPHWIDKIGLIPGTTDWEKALRTAIASAQSVVLVATPASRQSTYVRDELAIARMHGKAIYPVWAAGQNWIEAIPLGMGYVQNIDMRESAYATGLNQLIAALAGKRDDGLAIIPEVPQSLRPGIGPKNPYKGLQAFEEADENHFFGREALTERLAQRLQNHLEQNQARFLAVLGPSGAGKSSVVMAGLIPALKRNTIPGSADWTYLPPLKPGIHPIEHLADVLKSQMPETSLTSIEEDLNTAGGRMLFRLVQHLPGEHVLLYIDQFEELFTLTQDESERQQLISLIVVAATEPDSKLIIILSMRADFLGQTLNYPQLGPLFDQQSSLVQPMTIAELRDAIAKPAQLPDVGLSFDSGLVAEIIFALRGRETALAGALPLLQFTLERLFAEREGTQLTWTAYQKIGGVEGAIGTHGEAIFANLPQEVQDKLGQVFLPLVNIDEETGEPTRNRAQLDTVMQDPDAKKLVDALVEGRLLQTGREGDTTYFEITHEALFRSWQRLATWVASVRDDFYLLREMRRAAENWEDSGRNRDYLWLGERAEHVQAMLSRLEPTLNDVERAFVRPEWQQLVDELKNIEVNHERREAIGQRLLVLNDPRPGVGLRDDGLPDIVWCYNDVP